MRAEGGQIYQGNRFETSVTESARGRVDVSNLANRGVQEQLDRNKQQALTLYEQGLKLTASQSMEEAYNNYQNDPESLKAELDKISEKMTAEIPDMQTKVAFRANFITQSGSLINRAQANYDKIQYEKKKSSYFDTIQANNKSIAMALNNAFNGTGTADDLVNYQTAIKQNIDLINSRNDDGTYIFTDAQRLSMSNAVDKLAAESFSNALNDMDDDKRTQTLEALNKDSMILLQGEEEGEVKQLNLKDAFSPEIYADMKKSATILDNKIKKKQLAEYNLNKRYSQMMLNIDPSEQNYKIWEFYHRDATKEKKAQMRKMAGFVPNEKAETNFTGLGDAKDELLRLTNMPLDTEKQRIDMLDLLTDYVEELENANNRGDLSENDRKNLANMAYKMFDDRVFKEQVQVIFGQPGIFNKIANTVAGGAVNRLKIESQGIETIQNTITALLNNDPETAYKIYQDGVKKAITMRYPEIPFQSMKEGDVFWYNPTGKAYKFLGYGLDDILVEVDPNTGVRK